MSDRKSFKGWTYKTLPLEYRNTGEWRQVDESALLEPARTRFLRLKSAIEEYLSSGKLSSVAKEKQVQQSEIIRQLNRCVAIAPDNRLFGWAALIPDKRISGYTRKNAINYNIGERKKGLSGCFHQFMELHEAIKQKIDLLILGSEKNGINRESKISVKKIHRTFVALCKANGIRDNQYPINTKSQASRSLARYRAELINKKFGTATRKIFGELAGDNLRLGTGNTPHVLSSSVFDLVGIDAHKIHCFGTIRLNGPAGPQYVPIERLWILPVLEHECRVILSYSVGIRTECNAAVAEKALLNAMQEWKPRKLIAPDMQYKPGAGFPSGIYPELNGCAWTTLTVDNAAIHFSYAIAERVRRRVGCSVTWAPIGEWAASERAIDERLMRTLETYGFSRLPTTTGSSPTDPTKREPQIKAAQMGLDFELLLDLTDIILADYNVTPHENLGFRTPLQALGDKLNDPNHPFVPRLLPEATAGQPDLGYSISIRNIRGNASRGRRPFIEIDRVRYTNPILANAIGLIGKKLRVHIPEAEQDFRYVKAFFETGEELGILTAQGVWSKSFHTREMRKQINSLRDNRELSMGSGEDPIDALLKYLAKKTHEDFRKAPNKISKYGTKAANASYTSGKPIPSIETDKLGSERIDRKNSVPLNNVPKLEIVKPPVWKTLKI